MTDAAVDAQQLAHGDDAELMAKGLALQERGLWHEALAAFDELLAGLGERDDRDRPRLVSEALAERAYVLAMLGRLDDAVAACRELEQRFWGATERKLRNRVGWAVATQAAHLKDLERPEESLAAAQRLLRLDAAAPLDPEDVAWTLRIKADAVGKLENADAELEIYDELLERFGGSDDPGTCSEVAWGLLAKAFVLDALGRSEDELAVCDDVIARWDGTGEAELAEPVARAWVWRGYVLGTLDRPDEAVEAYETVAARVREAGRPDLEAYAASALENLGLLLNQLGRHGEEADAFARAAAAWARAGDEEASVARVIRYRADALGKVDGPDAELALYDEIEERFGAAEESGTLLEVAYSLRGKAAVLSGEGRFAEALGAYERLCTFLEDAEEPGLLVELAHAFYGRAWMLSRLGRREEALAAYDGVVERFGESTDPEIAAQVLTALDSKRFNLEAMGRGAEAVEVCNEMLARLDGAGAELRRQRVDVLCRKGQLLDRLQRGEEAIVLFDAAAAVFDEARAEGVSEELVDAAATALTAEAATLHRLGREEDALAAYDRLVSRLFADPAGQERVAAAMLAKAATLSELGRGSEANEVEGELLTAFGREQPDAPVALDVRRTRPTGSDSSTAAMLSRLLDGDCWSIFGSRPHDDASRAAFAERALDLYRRTKPQVESRLDEPAGQAALTIRIVADGFAVLSRRWPKRALWELPLPDRTAFESLIRFFGLDAWARDQGHRLDLRSPPEAHEAAQERLSTPGLPDEGGAASPLTAECVRRLWELELLLRLRESRPGRSVLRSDAFRDHACRRIAESRRWLMLGAPDSPELQAAVVLIFLLSETHFVESWTPGSSGRVFPSSDFIRRLLGEMGLLERLRAAGVALPDWLADD